LAYFCNSFCFSSSISNYDITMTKIKLPPAFECVDGGSVEFFAKDQAGQWYYVNHARTWQTCPPPFAQAVQPVLSKAKKEFDADFLPYNPVNKEAATAAGLVWDESKQHFVDQDGALIRDRFGQAL
jgi:hypothetical protein